MSQAQHKKEKRQSILWGILCLSVWKRHLKGGTESRLKGWSLYFWKNTVLPSAPQNAHIHCSWLSSLLIKSLLLQPLTAASCYFWWRWTFTFLTCICFGKLVEENKKTRKPWKWKCGKVRTKHFIANFCSSSLQLCRSATIKMISTFQTMRHLKTFKWFIQLFSKGSY